ncbi:MAG: FAD-dependent oxidoreductase [Microcella sp.]|uniref:GMC family oxidoreductase n=1 Tax=Microcella sp. TaxID=1913979 RepID=UPI0024CA202A|nr:FAD-dependent oxidoreductase [Microcella sp.]UYN83113.1 MAG: FAD-dependent oxidoreductase [Microcella sp.]
MTAPAADVIVVGAGGSGAPLARRLAERGATVLLLEEGPVPAPLSTLDASSLAAAMPGHPLAATFAAELAPGRPHTVVRGRVVGGSTAINGGYFRRARAHDLDDWATTAGDARWSAERTAPLWARLENDHDLGDHPGHGSTGPMPVTRSALDHPLSAALLAGGIELGLPVEHDKNASPQAPPGVGPTPTNTVGGERVSTARAYLPGAPATLEVRGGHRVLQVIVRAGRAVGVLAVAGSEAVQFSADLVVLCAGALSTPHVLMLSGIGPSASLAAHGIPVVVDAPAVGARLDDHPQLVLPFAMPVETLSVAVDGALGVSLHASSGVGGTASSVADLEVLALMRPLGRMLGTDDADAMLSLLVSPLRGSGGGRVELDPADALAPPRVRFNYAATDDDRARLRSSARFAARLLESAPLQSIGAVPVHRQVSNLDDEALDGWILANLSTALHSCGTTPMGLDPATSVVDGRGAVHGVVGLHVADVGMLPRAPTGGPAATAVLIGELIADALAP